MNGQPVVSVLVTTYNHERYIAQCLEGILMQRTTFPFEVIVGEDCSTDGTRAVVMDYARRYPGRIRALLHETNLGGQGQNNEDFIHQACRGKYHAWNEGDDYWIDPLKLQKQVDFMEAHPEVSLCFHNALIMNERLAATRLFYETPPDGIVAFEAGLRMTFPTPSLMVRSDVLATLPEWRRSILCGDRLVRLWCLHHGKVAYLDQLMAVYRRHAGGLDLMRRKCGHKAYYNDILFTMREFDKATRFAHTDSICREMKRLNQEQEHQRLGAAYHIMHPGCGIGRIKDYIKWIRQKRNIFN